MDIWRVAWAYVRGRHTVNEHGVALNVFRCRSYCGVEALDRCQRRGPGVARACSFAVEML